jgi:hypothetical protein
LDARLLKNSKCLVDAVARAAPRYYPARETPQADSQYYSD